MNLGTLIARLEHEANAAEALAALSDIVLFAEVSEIAMQFGETPGEYVAGGTQRFAAAASDEDWMGLIAAIEKADDPGKVALGRMLRWAMVKDTQAPVSVEHRGCSCGNGTAGGGCHDPT